MNETPSYNFKFDDEAEKSISSSASTFSKEYKESSGADFPGRVKTAYFQDGHHTFRIYPDVDKNGRARIIRRIFVHPGLQINPQKRVYVWEDERVTKLIGELTDAKMPTLFNKQTWQWYPQELGVMCAHIFETADKDWHPAGGTYIFLLRKRDQFAVQDFIAELHPEEKRKLLDPNNEAMGLKLSITRAGAKSNAGMGIVMRTYALPMPPMLVTNKENERVPFTNLDSVYIKEEDKLTEADWLEFQKNVYTELEKWKASGSQANDVTSKGETPGKKEEKKEEPKPEVKSSPNAELPYSERNSESKSDQVCPLAERIKIKPDMEETYGSDVRFGNHPTKNNPYCIICDLEEACIAETAKSKKAA